MFKDNNIKIVEVSAINEWWKGCVIYQIYCRSFYDSNNDGIGDLRGIINKLDYVKSIGVDAIWLTPFFESPMLDMGYDIKDHKAIDSLFGDMNDFDELIVKAHKLKIKVIIDLVLSHTSDQHEWFRESSLSKNNSKSDWYVWADAQKDGSAPNNWLSLFGGGAWQWSESRNQYYLHNFLTTQPDLNFHCPDVQIEQLDVIDFWSKRGVDGFRLDTVNFYFHDQLLRNNPLFANDSQPLTVPKINPYGMQDHLYDKSQPESLDFFEKIRNQLDKYEGLMTLGELGEDGIKSFKLMEQYTSSNKCLNMCYGFDLLGGQLSASKIKNYIETISVYSPGAWFCNSYSNHDVERHLSRWQYNESYKSQFTIMALNLLLCLKGSVCLYQGEEIGLLQSEISFEDLRDPYGIQFWPDFSGRDGCRTPMPWKNSHKYYGFSDFKPWLPVQADHGKLSVNLQKNNDNSTLSQYKYWINKRKLNPSLQRGDLTLKKSNNNLVVFERNLKDVSSLCIFNLSDSKNIYGQLNEYVYDELLGQEYTLQKDSLELGPYGFAILKSTIKD